MSPIDLSRTNRMLPEAGVAAGPLAPGVESLNVSVAAAVLLYEARRQREV